MLNLIVLGIVPGTSFTFTLWWVLFIAFILSLFTLIYIEIKKPRPQLKRNARELLINLELIDTSSI